MCQLLMFVCACVHVCGVPQVPFVELHGETAKFVEQAEDAIIAASNYRLHIKFKESLVNVSRPELWMGGREV